MNHLRFQITNSPYSPSNPVLGHVNMVNGVPCPQGLDENCVSAICHYLDGLNYVWLPSTKSMPEFDDQDAAHIRAAMAGLDCEGYHAEEV